MKLSRLGFGSRSPRGSGTTTGPLGSTLPTTDDLAPYLTTTSVGGYTKYLNVPWGPCFGVNPWPEALLGGDLISPVMDIYIPPGTPPVNGWPVIVRAHANGNVHTIPEGSGSLWDYLVVPGLTRGFVVITVEFRHPVSNSNLGLFHYDIGYCLQFIRGLYAALTLDRSRLHGFGQSRGNLLLWQAVAPNLKNLSDSNHAKRQDSTLTSLWGLNTQSTYNTSQYIDNFIDAGDRAAAHADPNYDDNPGFGSAYDLIVAGSQTLPFLCVTHDNPYVTVLPNYSVGTYPKSVIDANANLRVHCPEFGKHLWSAYSQRSSLRKITIADSVTGGLNSMADAVEWFAALDENSGISAKEARCMVMARRQNGSIHYITNPITGLYVSGTNLTPVTTVGSTAGLLGDGSYGYANRLNTVDPLGSLMKQTSASLRPVLSSINSGTQYGLTVDNVDDVLPIFLNNSSPDVYTWTTTGEVAGYSSRTSTKFELGPSLIGGRTIGLISANPSAVYDATSLKFLRQFAAELIGNPF